MTTKRLPDGRVEFSVTVHGICRGLRVRWSDKTQEAFTFPKRPEANPVFVGQTSYSHGKSGAFQVFSTDGRKLRKIIAL